MQHACRWFVRAACAAALIAGGATRGWGFTPESPVVQGMVKRAAGYLMSEQFGSLGHRALSAMALLKADVPSDHPLIAETVKQCQGVCGTPESVSSNLDIYESSVVALLFCELDPSRYRDEVTAIIRSLEQRQKPFGGWGYPQSSPYWPTGDTSMTQYVILCSWVARRTGAADISQDSIRKVTNWLLRTQDVRGAWGYQGRDPGYGVYDRVAQEEVRHSLCAAGLGSLYICADLLGFTSGAGDIIDEDDVPAALKLVVLTPRDGPRPDAEVDVDLVKRAIRDATRWYRQNYRIDPEEYAMYYLYTLERYQSFRELAEGRRQAEPGWYNDGVNYLRSHQKRGDGSWNFPSGAGTLADTAFAVLFLKRSAKKTIQKAQEEFDGVLTAGRGLPSSTADVKLTRGKIVRTPFQGTAEALLAILENAEHPDLDAAAAAAEVQLSDDPRERQQQLLRMRRLARAEAFEVRLAAVKTLATVRDLDNVPALVFALSDPDLRIVRVARDGLRFIGRKFGGFGLADEPSEEQRSRAIEQWKAWYLAIRPDAVFPE